MASLEEHQGHNWYERLLNLISIVKPGEGLSCLLLTANATILMACYYLLKVVREPLILAYGGAEYKSYATALQALVLMAVVPIFTMFYHKYSQSEDRSTIINRVLLFFASNLLIFILLDFLNFNIGMAFYVWLGIFSVMVVAQFWAFAADSYNVRVGQRLFGILAVGSTLGALIGSKLAGPIYPYVGVTGVMIISTFLILLSLFLTMKTPNAIPLMAANTEPSTSEHQPNQWLDGFAVIFQSKYLMLIALFMCMSIFINSTGEYIIFDFLYDESVNLFSNDQLEQREIYQAQFTSNYYALITLFSFLIQLFIVSRLINAIGVKGSILVLPVIMMVSYTLMLFFPVFGIVRYLMIAENSANYSIQNTTRHALFLPVPRKLKYLGKTTIDTFFWRLGDLLYGGFIFVGVTYFDFSVTTFILSNLIMAVGLFILAWRIGHYNRLAKQESMGNTPPEAVAALPRLHMPVGIVSKFSVSECTFYDPDVGDALRYSAKQKNGEPLPKWIKFDKMSRTFTFKPPTEQTDSLKIEITATDFEGATASSLLKVSFFADETDDLQDA
jgi:AAA family ATP:ADP antiporter